VARQVTARARRPPASVGDLILASKVTVPGVPDWAVPRPRITKLIAEGVRWCPLTVVTGPAGAGKTMALALWAAAEPGPVAWVGLDRYDDRPRVFWPYVVAALGGAGAAAARALTAAARGRAGDHVFLLRLASALAAQDPPVTLVLDDLHLVADPRVADGLDFLLRNAGPGLRLVVCSRMDPLLPLHRYRLAGELAEIRASDLAFSVTETSLLLARHGSTLSAGSLECLTRRTEGWAAGIRLAAISMDAHPDPDQFVKELIADDSALTGYLVAEVLNAQPPESRDLLLSTSILEQVSAAAARELTGLPQAPPILQALAHENAFVQPVGDGWYRYHPLFADVLRLKLRHEFPGRVRSLHRQAARWYERNGQLTDGVRHAAQAGDWPLAARMVIDGLAISEIIDPRDGRSLARELGRMPHREAWTEPAPYLVSAAAALAAGRPEPSLAALDAAQALLERLPAAEQTAGRLAAAMICLAAARRAGDLTAAAAATARAETLLRLIPGGRLARHQAIRARLLAARGAVELWSGHLDRAAGLLASGVAIAAASGAEHERADGLGHLALAEAGRGRLGRAAELAAEAGPAARAVPEVPERGALAAGEPRPPAGYPSPSALVALAWVHLERYELAEARSLLKEANAALGAGPDNLVGALACLVAAGCALAEGSAAAARQNVARARSGCPVPAWLGRKLSLAESRAHVAAGDTRAALAAAGQAGGDDAPEAAVMLARAWAAAGDGARARHALEPALAARGEAPELLRLQARLVDAQLSYDRGDRAGGRRSLAAALRLAEREQLRLPFVLERGWISPVLRHDPGLAATHRRLLAPAPGAGQLPAPGAGRLPARPGPPGRVPVLVEPLTEREQEVLRHFCGMLSTAEVAAEMYISVNTVKTHLKSIYRKLAATHRSEAIRRARQLNLI
jgi:LuxR family transcriptional regulator, maltose regulon positive regulatory protein